jgi:hypothetical protein
LAPRDGDRVALAAWFERRADQLDAIAAQEPDLACEAAELAYHNRAKARRLRGGDAS